MSIAPDHLNKPSQGSYLTPAFEHATVADAMHVGIITCAPDAPLATVARTMATHHVHCVAVLALRAESGEHLVARPIGVLSTLDVAGIVAWGRA